MVEQFTRGKEEEEFVDTREKLLQLRGDGFLSSAAVCSHFRGGLILKGQEGKLGTALIPSSLL